MQYTVPARLGVKVSRLGLGGHEFLPDGRSRGFNEDYARATTPGVLFPGFGGEKRKSVLKAAQEAGVNLFDVTIDSEKEALARNMKELPPPGEILVQTRPEGMCWRNNPGDPDNQRMADGALLQAEVKRILKLTGWPRLDFLNFGFMGSALDVDPDYLGKLSRNIKALKKEGLIRFATGDTFSGEGIYLKILDAEAFDAIFITLSFANDGGLRKVLPEAAGRGMAVFAREAFAKGELFKWGEEAGIKDRSLLARVALKWLWKVQEVTSAVVGAGTPAELQEAVKALESPEMSGEEKRAFELIQSTAGFKEYRSARRREFEGKE